MRTDTTSLLGRLGQRDFRYREFYDAFADMELWPIFEALLSDERIVGKPMSLLAQKEAAMPRDDDRRATPSPAPVADISAPGGGDLFARYSAASSKPERPSEDLRSFLKNLSTKQSEG